MNGGSGDGTYAEKDVLFVPLKINEMMTQLKNGRVTVLRTNSYE